MRLQYRMSRIPARTEKLVGLFESVFMGPVPNSLISDFLGLPMNQNLTCLYLLQNRLYFTKLYKFLLFESTRVLFKTKLKYGIKLSFHLMEQFRQRTQHKTIAYGVNLDDQGDYRPGQRAAQQHGVAAPLLQAGLTKADVRRLAREAGLRIWDKPASPCLSSRIEYGRAVTPEALAMVERGEEALRELGFEQFRVRHHGDIVRIEIAAGELPRAMSPQMAAEFTRIFKALGFKYVTLDLEGFRSGSMNDILPAGNATGAQTRVTPSHQVSTVAREIIKSQNVFR